MTWKKITVDGGLNQQAGIGVDGRSYRFKAADLVDHADKLGIPTQQMSLSAFGDLDQIPKNSDTEERIRKADPSIPIIALRTDDGSHMIVDGTHRARQALRNGMKDIPTRVMNHDQMKRFLSEDPVF